MCVAPTLVHVHIRDCLRGMSSSLVQTPVTYQRLYNLPAEYDRCVWCQRTDQFGCTDSQSKGLISPVIRGNRFPPRNSIRMEATLGVNLGTRWERHGLLGTDSSVDLVNAEDARHEQDCSQM